MSIQVETIGYRFRVSKNSVVYDVISTTELGMTKSNEIIRAFFDNFKILKSEKIAKQEDVVIDENKTTAGIEGSNVDKVGEDRKVKPARNKRESMKIMWGNLRELLSDEFTIDEYKRALADAGYEYTKGSWGTVPRVQLKKIIKLGKIEPIEGAKPAMYRKIKVPHSFRSDQEAEKTLRSLRNGEKAILGAMK